MADLDVARFRQKLLALKAELAATEDTRQDAGQRVELDQTRVGRLSRMDAMQGQAMAKAAQQRAALQSRKIEAALARIEAGEYGECVACGEFIAEKRLEADPTAAFCIACAEARERG